MPVFIYEPDAFEKMCQVEGEDYAKEKTKERFGACSFDAFKEKWETITKIYPEIINEDKDYAINVEGNHAIYGYGGWNRYFVYYSGEIVFAKSFTPHPKYIKMAESAGFRVVI